MTMYMYIYIYIYIYSAFHSHILPLIPARTLELRHEDLKPQIHSGQTAVQGVLLCALRVCTLKSGSLSHGMLSFIRVVGSVSLVRCCFKEFSMFPQLADQSGISGQGPGAEGKSTCST